MGSNKESEFLRIAKTTLWRWLEFLEGEGMLELKKTTKYTIVTIPKWEEYQGERNSNGKQTLPQVGTNNKNNNENKIVQEDLEIVEVTETEEKPKKIPKDEKALALCKWASDRRGFAFVSEGAQLGAIGRAKRAKISPTRLKERWMELEEEIWRNGFDWVDVVKSFDKRV